MKAWVIEEAAGGNRLNWQQVADLAPGPGELLLKVRAVGLNRADLMRRAGHYERVPTRPPAPIAGLEAAGEVIAVGDGVAGFAVGDRVMGMPSGAYAEQALLHARMAVRVPEGLGWDEAAALPTMVFTAHDALVTRGRLQRGESVLVGGASSGVGIAALQIARELGAAVIAGTAGSAEKLQALRAWGLTHGVDYRRDDVAKKVLEATGGQGADVTVDMVGGELADAVMQSAAIRGRWVTVGRLAGKVVSIDLDTIARKRMELIGVTFRTRSLDEVAALVAAAMRDLGPAIAARRIAMPIARRFGLDQADQAQALMQTNTVLGKIVLVA